MNTTDEVKQRLDIVDLIGEYVKLKPSGGSNFKACCPFHHEKTPSFYVSRDKQLWHCFGCGEGGDHFGFVMKMDGLDFADALRELAEKTGVEIKRFETESANEKTRLLKIVDLAARFYHKYLLDLVSAQIARDYLARREIPEDLIKKFKLGYAPDRWDSLTNFLKKNGFREQEIINAGVSIRRQDGQGIYDRFRHRVMFPVFDVGGRVVGFSGRLLDETREEGKYINTPQTLIYNKSLVLYGLHLAKKAIKESEAVIIVEGNMDVIASHKGGLEAVVASSGTAVTNEQLIILRRFTGTILICFDADAAGENAAKRGIDLALEEGMNVKVIRLPAGFKDPDDLVRKDSSAWRRAVAEATDIMTFCFDKAFARGLPSEAIEKKKIGQILLPEIGRLQDPIERAHWLHELAVRLGVTDTVLGETLVKIKKPVGQRDSKHMSAHEEPATSRRVKLAEAFLAMMLVNESEMSQFIETVKPEYLPETYKSLYSLLVPVYYTWQASTCPRDKFFPVFRRYLEEKSSHLIPIIDRLALVGEENYRMPANELQREFSQIRDSLRDLFMREIRERAALEIRQAELSGDKARIDELIKKFNELV